MRWRKCCKAIIGTSPTLLYYITILCQYSLYLCYLQKQPGSQLHSSHLFYLKYCPNLIFFIDKNHIYVIIYCNFLLILHVFPMYSSCFTAHLSILPIFLCCLFSHKFLFLTFCDILWSSVLFYFISNSFSLPSVPICYDTIWLSES